MPNRKTPSDSEPIFINYFSVGYAPKTKINSIIIDYILQKDDFDHCDAFL